MGQLAATVLPQNSGNPTLLTVYGTATVSSKLKAPTRAVECLVASMLTVLRLLPLGGAEIGWAQGLGSQQIGTVACGAKYVGRDVGGDFPGLNLGHVGRWQTQMRGEEAYDVGKVRAGSGGVARDLGGVWGAWRCGNNGSFGRR